MLALSLTVAVAGGVFPSPAAANPALDPALDAALDAIAPELQKRASICTVEMKDGKPQFAWTHYKGQEQGLAVDFWPASTVKLYTVVAALEQLNDLGVPMDSALIFEHQEKDGRWVLDCARGMREMMSEIFRRSSNEDYTLLLRFCGIDRINSQFLIPGRGFPHSALMRGYVLGRPYGYVREEPQRITVRAADGTTKTVEHTWSGKSWSQERGATVIDAATGNCTSTHELAECLRRVMFHEHLPESDRYRLTAEQLQFLREGGGGLAGLNNKEAGAFAWKDAAETVFPKALFYHKGGQISTYSLDLACIDDRANSGKCFVMCVSTSSGQEKAASEMARRIAEWVRDRAGVK